jgi:uncharacterized protein YfaA (DUF2138 family)
VDKVHRPGLVRPCRRPAIFPQLGLNPTLRRFVAQLQAQFAIDAARFVLAVMPTLATKNNMNAAIAVANANMADLLDPLFEKTMFAAVTPPTHSTVMVVAGLIAFGASRMLDKFPGVEFNFSQGGRSAAALGRL